MSGTTVYLGASTQVYNDWIDQGFMTPRSHRVYSDDYNSIPAAWGIARTAPRKINLSFRPFNSPETMNGLLAGKYDDALHTLINNAPPGAQLTAFHEASNLGDYSAWRKAGWFSGASMSRVHNYLRDKCRAWHSANGLDYVGYGPILCCPADQGKAWMGNDMDFIGWDIYDWESGKYRNSDGSISYSKLATMFSQIHDAKDATGSHDAMICIAETNSARAAYRAPWMNAMARACNEYGAPRMETFWAGHAESCTWDECDAATKTMLKRIDATYGPSI